MSASGILRRLRRFLLPSFDLLLLQRCRLLRLIERGATVLDAGCGDGTTSFRLVRRGCRVVAVSNDPEAIARLRDPRTRRGLPAQTIGFRTHDLARNGPIPPPPLPLGEGGGEGPSLPLPPGEGGGEGPGERLAAHGEAGPPPEAPHPPLSQREREERPGEREEGGSAARRRDTAAGPGGFDAAVCFDVLEHILDDRAALANIVASLRPGGKLLLTVPDRAVPPLWGDAVSAVEDGGHVRPGYTRSNLDELLRQAGLQAIRWGGIGGFFTRRATNVSRRLERRTGRAWIALRFAWLVLMRPLCRLDPLIPGRKYELFVLAEKSA